MSNLEFFLNVYLGSHFCGSDSNKIEEIILLIFGDDRTTLNSKAQIFAEIAVKHDKKWYNEYKSPRKTKSDKTDHIITMNKDLVYVIQERNIFAHRMFALPNMFEKNRTPDNVIRFIKFKNDLEPLDYTIQKLDEIYYVILSLSNHFIPKLKDKGIKLFDV